MSKFIFNVVDVWQEPDHIVVISDVPDTEADFRHGDLLELRRTDGKVLQAKGGSILFDPPEDRPFAVVFKGLTKQDVPLGTQVWLVNAERAPRKQSRHYEEKRAKEHRDTT
ncbi:MAG: hypothetical protein IT342_26695 [Candidatus Melainabacteria bacterium]|nr:hypothetical protein [Candidatus Melainabacteria bacterium]